MSDESACSAADSWLSRAALLALLAVARPRAASAGAAGRVGRGPRRGAAGLRAFGSCDGLRCLPRPPPGSPADARRPCPEALEDGRSGPGRRSRDRGPTEHADERAGGRRRRARHRQDARARRSSPSTANACARSTRAAGSPVLRGSIELPGGPARRPGRRLPTARCGRPPAGDRRRLRLCDAGSRATWSPRTSPIPASRGPSSPRSTSPIRRRWRVSRTMTVDGLLRQRPAHRLDRPPRELRLPAGRVRGAPATAAPWCRAMTIRDRATGAQRRGRLVGCDDVGRPSRFAGTGMLSVLTIDLRRGLPAVDADAVLTDGQIVYALADGALRRHRALGRPRPRLAGSQVRTEIHRFDTTDPERDRRTSPAARSSGYMLSQWSMSEQDGLLRVASTTSPPFDATGDQLRQSESFVTALAPDGRSAAPGRAGRRARPRRADLRGALHRRHRLRRHVPPGRPAVRARPLRPDGAPGVGRAQDPGLLRLPAPGRSRAAARRRTRRRRQTAPPGACRSRCSTSPTPRTRCALDRESFGAAASSEVEYDHHAFSWFAEHGLATLPIDSYARRAGGPLGRRPARRAGLGGRARAGGQARRRDLVPLRDPAHARARRSRLRGRGQRGRRLRAGDADAARVARLLGLDRSWHA